MKAIKMMYQVIEDLSASSINRKGDIIKTLSCSLDDGKCETIVEYMLDKYGSEKKRFIMCIDLRKNYDVKMFNYTIKTFVEVNFAVKVRMIKYEEIEGDKNEK